jgi:hypothetical protein
MFINRNTFQVLFLMSGLLASTIAQGFPLLDNRLGSQPWLQTLDLSMASSYDFEGIVSLGNCSGSLVRYADSQPQDAALVLTNGHCVELLDPGEVRFNETVKRSFQILAPNGRNLAKVTSKRLIYATMTGTDLALYELSVSYEQIKREHNTEPLTMSDQRPQPGTPIEVISGYWRRGYSCAIERIVHELREADWLMNSSIKYSDPGCQVIGGTSGSPVIDTESRTVVGVNNTTNESGQACKLNNPCEVDPQGQIMYQKGWSYGQQTYWLYDCRDEATGELDLTRQECQLPAQGSSL